ncbi:ArsC/Spx/MgsR family protein [Candidatus Zixiibacteriota bacterium]
MPLKRATFFTFEDNTICSEAIKFIEGAGYILKVHDLKKTPLTYNQLSALIGYVDIKHFLNAHSSSYKKHKLDQQIPERSELIKLIEDDLSLLKMPIIKSARLLTVGCNKQKISQMLQISDNGNSGLDKEPIGNIRNGRNKKNNTVKKNTSV